MRALAAGEERDSLGVRRGYVVVAAVPGEALERCFDDCLARWDEDQLAAFNQALADLAARLHSAGLAHRDLYTPHIFLDETPEGPRLYLIDLARVFKPCWRKWGLPRRQPRFTPTSSAVDNANGLPSLGPWR